MESEIYLNILEKNGQPDNQVQEPLRTGKYVHLNIHVARTLSVT